MSTGEQRKPLDFGGPPPFKPTEETLRLIATKNRCPQVGDSARLGDIVALGIEPYEPRARIVAFVHTNPDGTPAKGMKATIVREFQDGDSWYPTGELRGGALGIAWTPWLGAPSYSSVSS